MDDGVRERMEKQADLQNAYQLGYADAQVKAQEEANAKPADPQRFPSHRSDDEMSEQDHFDELHFRSHVGGLPSKDSSYLPGLGTIRPCLDCGCLTAGGPTRCLKCAGKKEFHGDPRTGADLAGSKILTGVFDDADLLESMAAYAHEAWSHWMKYLFSCCFSIDPPALAKEAGVVCNDLCIPAEKVERWQRQMKTPYEQLPEDEKHSDREQARTIIGLVKSAVEGRG